MDRPLGPHSQNKRLAPNPLNPADPTPSAPGLSMQTGPSGPSSSSHQPAPSHPPPAPPPADVHPPDPGSSFTYQRGVLSALSRMRPSPSGPVDQALLRRWLSLAPSYLMHDPSLAPTPEAGILGWAEGLHALVAVLQLLHDKGELEWETMDCASRAFAQCWSAARCWTGMERARLAVQQAGGRLRGLLDREDTTMYGGRKLYPATEQ